MPMRTRDGIILTGATGLLGRYLLRDLLLAGRSVVVLAHDSRAGSAADRVGSIVDFWNETLGRGLPRPTVLNADLTEPTLGLQSSDRAWLVRHCRGVVHAAAKVSMRRSTESEPWQTNVEGTRRLVELCMPSVRVSSIMSPPRSSAVTAPDRSASDDLDCGQEFHNDYERSKHEAERLVDAGANPGDRVPAVGHRRRQPHWLHKHLPRLLSVPRTGRSAGDAAGAPMRVGAGGCRCDCHATGRSCGTSCRWIGSSQAIVQIASRPRWHGRTFHVTAGGRAGSRSSAWSPKGAGDRRRRVAGPEPLTRSDAAGDDFPGPRAENIGRISTATRSSIAATRRPRCRTCRRRESIGRCSCGWCDSPSPTDGGGRDRSEHWSSTLTTVPNTSSDFFPQAAPRSVPGPHATRPSQSAWIFAGRAAASGPASGLAENCNRSGAAATTPSRT